MPKEYNEVWIHGRAINLEDPKLEDVKSVEDIEELKVFESLQGEKREDAEKQLLDAIKVNSKKPKAKPAKDKKGVTVLGTGKTQEELDTQS